MQFDPNIFSYIKKIKKINICILFLGMQDDQKENKKSRKYVPNIFFFFFYKENKNKCNTYFYFVFENAMTQPFFLMNHPLMIMNNIPYLLYIIL